MPVENEQDRQDMLLAEDWGCTVILATGTIAGIVDREYSEIDFGGPAGITATDPLITVSTADITALRETDPITIADSPVEGLDGDYTVKEIQPDGTGMSVIKLNRA